MNAASARRVVDEVRAAAADGDLPPDWVTRESRNFARTREAPAAQTADPTFVERWRARSTGNARDYLDRTREEPGWRSHANPTAQWCGPATGDPDGYETGSAVRERVAFHDRDGARLSGHLWHPADTTDADPARPGVVLAGGSGHLPEPPYWWFAGRLAAAGYCVLTVEPRGHGRSDADAPPAGAGAPDDPAVYVRELVDAVDFLRSTPERPYRHNAGRTDVPAPVARCNPHHGLLDTSRIGLVGHGLTAVAAAVVQGLAWPTGGPNPVACVVAWDGLPTAGTDLGGHTVEPRAPAMGQAGDYAMAPRPKPRPPEPDGRVRGVADWRDAGVPTAGLVVRGGTHYEWARVPTFPAREWEAGGGVAGDRSLAWLDRWLKRPGERGHADADARLLAPVPESALSTHYRSPRAFPDRDGTWHADDRRGDPFVDDGAGPGERPPDRPVADD
jgi:hypothetical protein